MNTGISGALPPWSNFYLITGSAAAALTGLQFLVHTLLVSGALRPTAGVDPEGGIAAFGTPTVVHFAVTLVISALLCAPWSAYEILRIVLGIIGLAMLAYSVIVLSRARRQRGYMTTAYDWIFHVVLPAATYTTVLLAAAFFDHAESESLIAVAIATLLLLCIGIHNAWDSVTYLTISALRGPVPHHSPAPKSGKAPARGKHRR
jgi:hypothetical protein